MIDHTKVSLADLAAGAVDVPNRIVNFPTGQRLLLDYNLQRGRQTKDIVLLRQSQYQQKYNEPRISDSNSRAKYIFGM